MIALQSLIAQHAKQSGRAQTFEPMAGPREDRRSDLAADHPEKSPPILF
jgi:hypothetical protein